MMQAINDWIIVEPIKEKLKTEGGIYLPHKSQREPTKGKVISIGEKITAVKVGQVVLFKRWEATELKEGKTLYFGFLPKHLLAVVEE